MFKPINLLLLTATFLQGCKVGMIQFKSFGEPKIQALGMGDVQVEAGVVMYNPNWFGMRLLRIGGDVFVDDIKMGTIGIADGFRIRRKSDFTIPLTFKIEPSRLLNGGLGGIMNMLGKKNHNVRLSGSLDSKVWLRKRSLPFEVKRDINLGSLLNR
jgi:LEA14-like dessication related protein